MNYIKRYLVLVIGLAVSLATGINVAADFQVSKIDENQVMCKRDLVAQYVQRNRYEKLAVYGIMASIISGGLYYMMPHGAGGSLAVSQQDLQAMIASLKVISESSGKTAPVVQNQSEISAAVSESNVIFSAFNGLKNVVSPVWNAGKEFVVWSVKTGWQGAVSSFMLHHMLVVSRFPERYSKPFKNFGLRLEKSAANLYECLFFKPTLQWYITHHTHLKDTFRQLYNYAYVLENHRFPEMLQPDDASSEFRDVTFYNFDQIETQLSDVHVQLYFEKFESSWSLCLHDIEGIIGFLEFKKTHVPEHAAEYEQTIRAIRLVVETFITKLESQYSNIWKTQQIIPELGQEIKNFTHLLQIECDSCIIFEHAFS